MVAVEEHKYTKKGDRGRKRKTNAKSCWAVKSEYNSKCDNVKQGKREKNGSANEKDASIKLGVINDITTTNCY